MRPQATIQFLGAAGTVTGSKFLVEVFQSKILIDCGVFQGLKALRLENWKPFPIAPKTIDTVLLTHGHLDHVGYLPKLVQQGFKGRIKGTAPTLAIARIILMDSAKIHEEEALRANKEQYTKHKPALPFFTIDDVENTLKLFDPEVADKWIALTERVAYRFQYNGHIIGATFIELDLDGKRLVFSGDIGRCDDLLLNNPQRPEWADILVLESTYGNKQHPEEDVDATLAQLIEETIDRDGNLIIPSFAVERLQTLMYRLWRLYNQNRIPNIPIFVDSPMGNNVLEVFQQFPKWHKLSDAEYQAMCRHVNILTSYAETWKTIDNPLSKVIIAGSGMVSGGRVLTYLQQLIDRPETTVLLVGYQAEGTRGRQLLEGANDIKLFGKYYPVKARIRHIESLSAHADQQDLLRWLETIHNTPEAVYLVHGEPTARDALRVKIEHTLHWPVRLPQMFDVETMTL